MGVRKATWALAICAAWLAACTTTADPPRRKVAALSTMRREDILWIERVSFGINAASVAVYQQLGRPKYLDRQLRPGEPPLPAAVAAQIDGLAVTHVAVVQLLGEINAERKRINTMTAGPDKEAARKALDAQGNKLAYDAIRRDLLRAVYSPAQLQEQMVWFWLNHFSVYQYKGDLRWLIGDYEEHAIRPHVFGRFRDLVLATIKHPAMLQYLDNNQNAAGHLNENYARELLELHTLGVDGGYSQADVQTLARILTGAGINAGDPPKLSPTNQAMYRREGVFQFDPARHDFGPKTLLGQPIHAKGMGEIEEAVDTLVRTPACAQFISKQLATYFVADTPPPALVAHMVQTWMHTDGDIAAVLQTLFSSRELSAALGGKFKDPMRFVVSSVRLAYEDRSISNIHPMLNWLNGLNEAPYGRFTPDGYPLTEQSWASAGQLSRRFEIARSIGAGNAGLFDPENGGTPSATGFPQLSNRLYFEAVEPFLGARVKVALKQANSQQEWNTFLLSSPDFAYE